MNRTDGQFSSNRSMLSILKRLTCINTLSMQQEGSHILLHP